MDNRPIYICAETSRIFDKLSTVMFEAAGDIFANGFAAARTIYCFRRDQLYDFMASKEMRISMSRIVIAYNENYANHIDIRRIVRKVAWPNEKEFDTHLFGDDFARFYCDLAAFSRSISQVDFAEYCKIGQKLFGAKWRPSTFEYCGARNCSKFVNFQAKKMIGQVTAAKY